jgi:hypothetical protein
VLLSALLLPSFYVQGMEDHVFEKYAIFLFKLKVIDFGFVEYGICSME